MKKGSVYKITNSVNGKVYIGLTTSYVSDRWYQHKRAVSQGCNSALYSAIRKYGIDKFSIETIAAPIDVRHLPELETLLIKQYGSYGLAGYNMSYGGENGIGRTLTESGKASIKAARNTPDALAGNSIRNKLRMSTVSGKAHQTRMVEAARNAKDNQIAGRKAYAATDAGKAQLLESARKGAARKAELSGKKVAVGSIVFKSVKEAADDHGIERGAVRYRIKSDNFHEWQWAC